MAAALGAPLWLWLAVFSGVGEELLCSACGNGHGGTLQLWGAVKTAIPKLISQADYEGGDIGLSSCWPQECVSEWVPARPHEESERYNKILNEALRKAYK